ncbi:MAG TPA: translation initiation factor [Anaeromyxobacteraceae bacterium]|jgi:translation initiation factor 1|nr:translation initiation factor [Anaeromyxobacteraceae bacterium]
MAKRDKGPGADAPQAPFHNPFAALRDRVGTLPPGPAAAPPHPAAERSPAAPARAVVRLERKGRGGKEVTVVEKLDLPATALDHWLKELKRSLGCGGAVEGNALVLQGDLRERAAALLELKGVKKVTKG